MSSFRALFSFAVLSVSAIATRIDCLERDVCIIGGGASGTYAAVRLQQMGKSVALIEREDRLGGHVNTYEDPTTGQTYDYGVQVFSNVSVLSDFFAHFDVPLETQGSSGGGVARYANFGTGVEVPASVLASGNITAAWLEYVKQEAKYPTIFREWDLPDPVPEDLLMPFGDFVKKYSLNAMVFQAFSYDQGSANLLKQPTLYVMKYQDQVQMRDFLEGTFVRNSLGDNQELYNRAQAELEPNVFLNSDVKSIHRHHHGVKVTFASPEGDVHVKASKLLISIPPKLSNLDFLDLDRDDQNLLGQFNNSYYWDAMLQNTGIPDNTSVTNLNPDAAYNLPALPGVYTFQPTPIKGVHATYYSSPHFMSDEDVKTDILATLKKTLAALGYPLPKQEPEFLGFHNHSPFILTASNEAIKEGFYQKLLALQGKRRTWWTGAAWMNQATATVWKYTEEKVLPSLLGQD